MGTPQEEQLKELYEKYKKDLDGGGFRVMVKFSEQCFNEFKALGDKAKVADIHKYIAAMYHVTVDRMEAQFKKYMEEISKLD